MKRRILLFSVLGLLLVCIAGASVSALSNRDLPTGPVVLDHLDPLDKVRLQETLHFKRELGEAVWPGWGQADIPIILWNAEYSFLVGYPNPPASWEQVNGDDFEGQPYYRQPTRDPQNFTLLVGERWVASMGTKWVLDKFLITQFQTMMPGPLKPVFPYRVLIQPTEVQMTGVLHESFHVYAEQIAPAHMAQATEAYTNAAAYWVADTTMHVDWEQEINLLAQALAAQSEAATKDWVRQFLAQRDARRANHQLTAAAVEFERLIEWQEGLAKYVELSSWRVAATTPSYAPLPALANDPDFKSYTTYDQRWAQELWQMQQQAMREGDVRFYYTGMTQAMLLDRLLPGWKDRILTTAIALEDLLREVVGSNAAAIPVMGAL